MCPASSRDVGLPELWDLMATSSCNDPSRLKLAFELLDRDGDGKIRSADLSAFFATCVGQAVSDEEVKSMITMADLDGDGAVGLEEFQHLMHVGVAGGADDTLRRAESRAMWEVFHVLDVNRDGLLSREDLKSAMAMCGQLLSDEDLAAMVAAAGSSNTNTTTTTAIDFESFSKLMTAYSVHSNNYFVSHCTRVQPTINDSS